MEKSNIEVVNRKLYEVSVTSLIILLILSLYRFDTDPSAKQEIFLSFIQVKINVIDVPLIVGLIALDINLFNFYTRVILKIKEEPLGQEIFSLVGMICMLTLNILVFTPTFFSVRFFLIAILLGLNVLKNKSLCRLLSQTTLERRSIDWYREAKFYFYLSLGGGMLFFILLNSLVNIKLLNLLISGSNLQFKKAFHVIVPLAFYLLFLYLNCRTYIKNVEYFKGEQYASDWKDYEESTKNVGVGKASGI